MSMRAWQVHKHGLPEEVLRLADLAVPQPGPGELRVRVEAAAIGMPDVFMCRGTYRLTPALPFVPGQEVCGIVDAIGESVDVAVGTRVMGVTSFFDGRGGFADFAIMYPSTAYRVPDSMPSEVAAAFRIGYSTAWTGLVRRGELQPDEWLVVLGAAGGSGAAAVQVGCALGARVIAVAAGEEKLAFCKRLGAQAVIDRTKGSLLDVTHLFRVTGTRQNGAVDAGPAGIRIYTWIDGAQFEGERLRGRVEPGPSAERAVVRPDVIFGVSLEPSGEAYDDQDAVFFEVRDGLICESRVYITNNCARIYQIDKRFAELTEAGSE
jgi:Zn-dependent alcohol dehydrogenase